jgi:hypothetical protein
MQDDRAPSQPIAVSPDNPCPFLRAAVAEGFVDGHTVPLSTLAGTVKAASGTQGLKKAIVGLKTYFVALIANGICTLRPVRSWWSGAQLDELRNGPLDKHGVGSRILDASAHVDETEIARLADFGKDRPDPSGGIERGLTAPEITAFMDANFARAKGHRRWFDRQLMNGEWPVLLDIMGKGEGADRYLSVAEVRTLFVERRLPERIAARLPVPASALGVFVKKALAVTALVVVALALAMIELPDQMQKILPAWIAQVLPPPLPNRAPAKPQPGSIRTGPRKTGTGFIMPVRAPRPFRCPMTGLSRWNSPAFIWSPSPVCSVTVLTSSGLDSCQARNPSTPMQQAFVALVIQPRPTRRRHPSRLAACGRRRSRISTACRSVSHA